MRSPVGPFRAQRWRCLSEDIGQESFAHKHTELRDRLASIKLQLDPVDRSHDETAELAARFLELMQTIRQQWLTADYPEKRRLLEIVFLNCILDGVTLAPTMRKPFDILAEGLVTEKVGVTRHRLNFFSGELRTGMPGYGGKLDGAKPLRA